MIAAALHNIDSYIAYFSQTELPVLRQTVRELAALREQEESVNGRRLASIVLQDPLMTLRVLTYIESHRRSAQNHDITTIERAIMMMGISPFFEKFADLSTLEDRLAKHPRALLRVLKVIRRARQASSYAHDWALIRHDVDVDEITVAALLHDAAEILCGCFAPDLTEQVSQLMQKTPGLRSSNAQKAVFGFSMQDMQLALAKAWHLPELLITLMNDQQARNPRVRNVLLANNLARHASKGWTDPALPDDYSEISQLLHMSQEALLNRLGVPEEFWPGGDSLPTESIQTDATTTNTGLPPKAPDWAPGT